jgi:hypothetical protein
MNWNEMVARNVRTPHTNCDNNLQKFLAFSLYEFLKKYLTFSQIFNQKIF